MRPRGVRLKYTCGPFAGTWFTSLSFQSRFLHPTSLPVTAPAVGPFHNSQSPGLGSFLGADSAFAPGLGQAHVKVTRGKQVGSPYTRHCPQGTSCGAPSAFLPAASSCLGQWQLLTVLRTQSRVPFSLGTASCTGRTFPQAQRLVCHD